MEGGETPTCLPLYTVLQESISSYVYGIMLVHLLVNKRIVSDRKLAIVAKCLFWVIAPSQMRVHALYDHFPHQMFFMARLIFYSLYLNTYPLYQTTEEQGIYA
jgi:hypothetical protein